MRKFTIAVLLIGLMVVSSACSKSIGSIVSTKYPTLDNLDIQVEELTKDGESAVMAWFTNNSKYTITYLKIRYKINDDVTKEDLVSKYDYGYGYPDDWDTSYAFMDIEIGDDYNQDSDDAVIIKQGETSKKTEVYRNNIFRVGSIEEFNNFHPDIMTVKYLDNDNQKQTVYYNYNSKKYNMEGE